MEIKKSLGLRIRALRKAKGYTIEGLAEMANLSPTFLGQTERGAHIPSIKTCLKLADVLGVSLSRLFDFGRVEKVKRESEAEQVARALGVLVRSSKMEHGLLLLDIAKAIRKRLG